MMRTKRILAVCMAGVLMTGTLTCVSAKTLKESFSVGTKLECLDATVTGNMKSNCNVSKRVCKIW